MGADILTKAVRRTRFHALFLVIFLATVPALAGCWSGGSSKNPAFSSLASLEPMLVSTAVDCHGAEDAAGKIITQHAGYASAAQQMLDGELQRFGSSAYAWPAGTCSELVSARSLDDDVWSRPMAPTGLPDLLQSSGARSILVPVVTSDVHCSNEGAWADTSYVEYGTSQCREQRVTLAAFLFAADGKVAWKSVWQLNIGNETPDIAGGVEKLLKTVPRLRTQH